MNREQTKTIVNLVTSICPNSTEEKSIAHKTLVHILTTSIEGLMDQFNFDFERAMEITIEGLPALLETFDEEIRIKKLNQIIYE